MLLVSTTFARGAGEEKAKGIIKDKVDIGWYLDGFAHALRVEPALAVVAAHQVSPVVRLLAHAVQFLILIQVLLFNQGMLQCRFGIAGWADMGGSCRTVS